MSCYVNTVKGPVSPRVYLKTPNAPGQRTFSRCAAPFFLEIRQYSCEKMSCSAQKFLAAGHIGRFQIHPNGFRSYRHAAPPHSTAVKPVRAGASSVCGAISTGAVSGLKAIKTRMSVSGSGVMVRRALLV